MYDLHSLGWHSFQQLCLTITREVLGQTVLSFLDSGDGGRDGAFAGSWRASKQEIFSGQFVIQCKFTSKQSHIIQMSDLAEEIEKASRLVQKGLCDVYILMTNAGLSGSREEQIKEEFKAAGVKHVATYGSTWINQQIRENKRLRMLVPRVYGLGDLSQILDERAYAQARAILDSLREDLAKVVVTDSYRRAAEALDKHSFVLLIGEPAAGKTTIAALLAMAALDQWQSSMLKLDEPGKVAERWNPDEPSQFFWLDDAFGVTQYEDFLARRWNHILPQVKTMLRKGAKIVMTSRDYIYNRARNDLKDSAFPLLRESQVVIDVHDLSLDEKRQILYNHLKLGKQPRGFLTEIKGQLEGVASHPRFIPETARRLADPVFTRGLILSSYSLGEFVDRREQLLQEVLHGLDDDSRAALALIYMRGGRLESPISLQHTEVEALGRLNSNFGGCISALEALKGSLVICSHTNGDSFWRFKHPTIGDAYAASLVQSPELLGIYIHGTATERLVDQITCGDVGIENAVIVPKSLFPLVLEKLSTFSSSHSYKSELLATWGAGRQLKDFLARRASREFLALYVERHPDLLDAVSEPGLYLYAVPDARLAARLHEFGLLPESHRAKFVETVSNYAIEGEDPSALSDDVIRTVFTEPELTELYDQVRLKLLPRLGNIRRERLQDSPTEMAPEDRIQPVLDMLEALKECFRDDQVAVRAIEKEIAVSEQWISEQEPETQKKKPRKLGKLEASDQFSSARSLFDDIDAH